MITIPKAISSLLIVTPVGGVKRVISPARFTVDPDSVTALVAVLVFESVRPESVRLAMLLVDVRSVEPEKTRLAVPLVAGAVPLDQLLPMPQSAVPLVPTQVCASANRGPHAKHAMMTGMPRRRTDRTE